MVRYGMPMTQEDEAPGRPEPTGAVHVAEDNSLGRLLTLSDGIFAIAMTLLALDLKVPDLGGHPGDAELRHALAANSTSYFAYLLTFYVIMRYWSRHRRLLRSVVKVHHDLMRDTLFLLLLVAAMPFPASLLGRYGSEPISLSVYGAVNALATLMLIVISWDVRRLGLADELVHADDYARRWHSWWTLVVFLVAIPAGYLVGHRGPYVLLLLLVPTRIRMLSHVVSRLRARGAAGRLQP